jgi:hypothetical protein
MVLLPRCSGLVTGAYWSVAAVLARAPRRIPVYSLGRDSSRTAAVTSMSFQV